MKTKCNCCDSYFHEKSKFPGLTNGDIFLLIKINAGGFDMIYIKDIENLKENSCLKRTIIKLLNKKLIEKDNKYGTYRVTEKGFNLIVKNRIG